MSTQIQPWILLGWLIRPAALIQGEADIRLMSPIDALDKVFVHLSPMLTQSGQKRTHANVTLSAQNNNDRQRYG